MFLEFTNSDVERYEEKFDKIYPLWGIRDKIKFYIGIKAEQKAIKNGEIDLYLDDGTGPIISSRKKREKIDYEYGTQFSSSPKVYKKEKRNNDGTGCGY